MNSDKSCRGGTGTGHSKWGKEKGDIIKIFVINILNLHPKSDEQTEKAVSKHCYGRNNTEGSAWDLEQVIVTINYFC